MSNICDFKKCTVTDSLNKRHFRVQKQAYGRSYDVRQKLLIVGRGVTRALIGKRGGVYIHIFVNCPTNFF